MQSHCSSNKSFCFYAYLTETYFQMFPLVRLMREKAGAIAPESWQDTLSKLQPSWDALCGLERAKYDKNTLPMSFLLSAYGGITAENLKTTRDACQLMDNCGWMACFGCTFTDLDEKLAEVGKLVATTKKQVRPHIKLGFALNINIRCFSLLLSDIVQSVQWPSAPAWPTPRCQALGYNHGECCATDLGLGGIW